jgi:hypothetical protein
MALVVHGDQGFLDQILDLVRQREEPPALIRTQVARKRVEKASVRDRVASKGLDEQAMQRSLGRLPAFLAVSSWHPGDGLQRRQEEKSGRPRAAHCARAVTFRQAGAN